MLQQPSDATLGKTKCCKNVVSMQTPSEHVVVDLGLVTSNCMMLINYHVSYL
jgi:hypothetical protein